MGGDYLRAVGRTLWAHHAKFWISLVVVYFIGGVGWLADYPTTRNRLNGMQTMIHFPQDPQWWWIPIPFLIWLAVSLLHREAIRQLSLPRLSVPYLVVVDGVQVETAGGQKGENVSLVSVKVVNAPISMETGKNVIDATANLAFYNYNTHECIGHLDNARWEEAPRPLSPYDSTQRFITLQANGSSHTLNMLVKHKNEDCMYGLSSESQCYSGWRNQSCTIRDRDSVVRIEIKGTGMREPFVEWMRIKYKPDGIIEADVLDERQWLGRGMLWTWYRRPHVSR